MILSEQQVQEFRLLAQPLMDFLRDLPHPHFTAVITDDRATVLEGLAQVVRPGLGEVDDQPAALPPGVSIHRNPPAPSNAAVCSIRPFSGEGDADGQIPRLH